MSNKRYTDEFKPEAIKQITKRGHSVADVASRLGVSTHSLYAWLRSMAMEPSMLPAAMINLPRLYVLTNLQVAIPL
jgi:transposase